MDLNLGHFVLSMMAFHRGNAERLSRANPLLIDRAQLASARALSEAKTSTTRNLRFSFTPRVGPCPSQPMPAIVVIRVQRRLRATLGRPGVRSAVR